MKKPITPERLEEIAKWIYEHDPTAFRMIQDLQAEAEQIRNFEKKKFSYILYPS